MSSRKHGDAGPPVPRRRRGLVAGALVAGFLVAGVLVAAAGPTLSRGGDDPAGASASAAAPATTSATPATTSTAPDPTSAASPTSPSGPPLSEAPELGDAVVADELPPGLTPVPLHGTAAVADDGVSATLAKIEAVDGTGTGPGNVAGPALRVTVRVANGSAGPLDLDAVVVSMSSGVEQVPASPLGDPSAAPLTGPLAPGDTAEGVYVFSVPADVRDLVTVSVSHRADAPFMVFSGSVG
jgi:hypothetical protein